MSTAKPAKTSDADKKRQKQLEMKNKMNKIDDDDEPIGSRTRSSSNPESKLAPDAVLKKQKPNKQKQQVIQADTIVQTQPLTTLNAQQNNAQQNNAQQNNVQSNNAQRNSALIERINAQLNVAQQGNAHLNNNLLNDTQQINNQLNKASNSQNLTANANSKNQTSLFSSTFECDSDLISREWQSRLNQYSSNTKQTNATTTTVPGQPSSSAKQSNSTTQASTTAQTQVLSQRQTIATPPTVNKSTSKSTIKITHPIKDQQTQIVDDDDESIKPMCSKNCSDHSQSDYSDNSFTSSAIEKMRELEIENRKLREFEIENQKLRATLLQFESMNKSNQLYQTAIEQTTPSLKKAKKTTRIQSPTPQEEQQKTETQTHTNWGRTSTPYQMSENTQWTTVFDPSERTTTLNQHVADDSPIQPQIIVNTTNIDDLKFDGTTNVHDFIKLFQTKAQDLHWNDEYKRVKIKNCLVDYAALVYDKWEASDKTSISRILSRLRLDFGGDPTQFLTKFMSIMPKHDQSVKSYVAELYKVLKEAQAALDDTLKEGLIKSRLTANLAPKAITLAAQEKSVSLLKYVELIETVMPKFNLIETSTTTIDTNKIVAQVLEQLPQINKEKIDTAANSSNAANNSNTANNIASANYVNARPSNSAPQQYSNQYSNQYPNQYSNQYSNLHSIQQQSQNSPFQQLTNQPQQQQYASNSNQPYYNRNQSDNRPRRGNGGYYNSNQRRYNNRDNRNYRGNNRNNNNNRNNYRNNQHRQNNRQRGNNQRSDRRDDSSDDDKRRKAKVNKCSLISNSKSLLPRETINFKIGNEKMIITTLIDSGSSISFVKESTLTPHLREELARFRNSTINYSNKYGFRRTPYNVQTAMNNAYEQIDCITVTARIKINKWSKLHDFVICEQLSEHALLGFDFFAKHNLSLVIQNNEFKICEVPGDAYEIGTSKLKENVTLNTDCEQLVEIKVDKCFANKMIVFEPNDHSNQSITLAKTLATPDMNGNFVVKALNYGQEPAMLKKNQLLGIVEVPEAIMDVSQLNKLKQNDEQLYKYLETKVETGKDVSSEQRQRLIQLLVQHKNVLSLDKFDIGLTEEIKVRIDTGNQDPVKQPAYKSNLKQKRIIETELNQLVKHGIVEASSSPWSSPVVLIKKKDNTLRFCIDFRKINKITKKDAYPLPRIDEIIESIGNSRYFSTIDLASGYWQVPIDPRHKAKTAFSTHKGLYEFNVMPFGLTNGPATFQRLMDRVLNRLTWHQCLVYIDDIIVFSNSFDEHLTRLGNVFECLANANLKLKLNKCRFVQDEVLYLGFKLTKDGIKPSDSKIKAIQQLAAPKTKREVKGFIGMLSYYRRFIPSLSRIAKPILELTKQSEKFIWSDACSEAFKQLKELLISAPVLAFPVPDQTFVIECDASGKALGSVLSQEPSKKPIAYASRTLSEAELKLSATEREALAVAWSCQYFKSLIYGQRLIIYTDHKPLITERNFKDPDTYVAKQLMKIQHLNAELKYKRGNENINADFLSRANVNSVKAKIAEAKAIEVIPTDWSTLQANDKELKEIYDILKSKGDLKQLNSNNSYFKHKNSILLNEKNNMLYKLNQKNTNQRIVVPRSEVKSIMQFYHDHKLHGHLGVNKTVNKINQSFYWSNMQEEVTEYVNCCHSCQIRKHQYVQRARLEHLMFFKPFELVGIDITGPFKTSDNQEVAIICAIDYFSKYAIIKAIPDQTAFTTAKFISEEIICKYGIPKKIITDQGSNFEAELTTEMCKLLKIDKLRTTPYHPECNGEVERLNKTLKQMISAYIEKQHTDWNLYLPYLNYAYNVAIHESTGMSPFEIIFGHKESNLFIQTPHSAEASQFKPNSYLDLLIKAKESIHQIVKANLSKAKEKMDKYQKTSERYEYQLNDLVLLNNKRTEVGLTTKFLPKYQDHVFKIVQILYPNFKLESMETKKTQFVHYNRLKPYRSADTVSMPEPSSVASSVPAAKPTKSKLPAQPAKNANNNQFRLEVDQANILNLSSEVTLLLLTSTDLKFKSKVERDFDQKFQLRGKLTGEKQIGDVTQLKVEGKNLFVLFAKEKASQFYSYKNIELCLQKVKAMTSNANQEKLAISKIGTSFDGLKWGRISSLFEKVFECSSTLVKACIRSNVA